MKKIDKYDPCPCCSGEKYNSCCKPYHAGEAAPTPLKLMRSRYSAYAAGLAEYLTRTTHPKNADYKEDARAWQMALDHYCAETRFTKLEIVEAEPGSDYVTFTATAVRDGQESSFTEKSLFKRDAAGRWLYLSGD